MIGRSLLQNFDLGSNACLMVCTFLVKIIGDSLTNRGERNVNDVCDLAKGHVVYDGIKNDINAFLMGHFFIATTIRDARLPG